MSELKVPLFALSMGPEERDAICKVLDSNWITMGDATKEFETAFAAFMNARHAIAVSSATAAMHLAYLALGMKSGDEVICPALTFVATANTIAYTGATPVFADIAGIDDLTICPDDVESKISDRTRGIAIVHYAGFPCAMDKIKEIANRHGLFVLEDVAHAPGGTFRGQKLGTIGDIGCFSFFSNKNMTTAEGGMVVTNNDELADKIRIGRSHGMTSLTWDRHRGHDYTYDVVGPGYNYRLDDLRAGLGIVQLGKLEASNRRRKTLWEFYSQQLEGLEEIKMPFNDPKGESTYHILPTLLSNEIDRRSMMAHLRNCGVQSSVHYPPVHLFSYYRNLSAGKTYHLPLTEEAGERELTLPLYPAMTEDQIHCVVKALKSFTK